VRRIFTSILPTVVTGIAGLLTFATFIVPALTGQPDLVRWREPLVSVAVIIAGAAVVLGFLHLIFGVHVQRIRQGKGVVYSISLILFAGLTFGLMFAERLQLIGGPNLPVSNLIFNSIIVPMQSALGALLVFFLALAALRMMQRRRTFGAFWFLFSALIVLITQVPLPLLTNDVPLLGTLRQVVDAMTTGGMRGLLLGVALGTIATAFRVLVFIDRPQSE
jgi:hypothetical protein